MKQRSFITYAVTGAGDGHRRNPNGPSRRTRLPRRALLSQKAGAANVHIHVSLDLLSNNSRRSMQAATHP